MISSSAISPKLAISSSTPLLTIESRNIQRATIPEESSRANSEVDLQRKLSSESAKKFSIDLSVSEVDKSSSQSSLPVINVTDNEGVTEDLVIDNDDELPVESKSESIDEEKTPVIEVSAATTEFVVEKEAKEEISELSTSYLTENPHLQIIEIEIETHAEPSAPDEQTISKENIPSVMRKLSVHEEAEKHQQETETEDEDEDLEESDSFVPGYVAPGKTSSF